RSFVAELAERLKILLQVFCGEVRRDLTEAQQLPELPERKVRQLVSLADRQPALLIQVDSKLDEYLIDGQACRVKDILRDFEMGGGRHQGVSKRNLTIQRAGSEDHPLYGHRRRVSPRRPAPTAGVTLRRDRCTATAVCIRRQPLAVARKRAVVPRRRLVSVDGESP